jgi:hypothetical protein
VILSAAVRASPPTPPPRSTELPLCIRPRHDHHLPTHQLLDYATERNSKGWTRISKVRMLVTDPSGAPIPSATVSVRWSHVPAAGPIPDDDAAGGGGTGPEVADSAAAASGLPPPQQLALRRQPAAAFQPAMALARTRGSSGARGTFVTTSPYAPSAAIRLEVLTVDPPRYPSAGGGPWPWPAEPAGSSDAVTDFVWP